MVRVVYEEGEGTYYVKAAETKYGYFQEVGFVQEDELFEVLDKLVHEGFTDRRLGGDGGRNDIKKHHLQPSKTLLRPIFGHLCRGLLSLFVFRESGNLLQVDEDFVVVFTCQLYRFYSTCFGANVIHL